MSLRCLPYNIVLIAAAASEPEANERSSSLISRRLHYDVDMCLTVDDAWTSFKDNFIKSADRHAPMCSKRVRSNTLPWINDHIRGLIMQRNFHHKKAQKSGSSNEWNIYRSLRNEVSTCIRKAKETCSSNLIVENKSNSSKLWSVN